MKKAFTIGKLNKVLESESKNSLVIAYRTGDKLIYSNIESVPEGRVKLDWDGNEFTIKIKLNKDEYVAVGDAKGKAKKGEL